jgi:iduronate 2-sulfatase
MKRLCATFAAGVYLLATALPSFAASASFGIDRMNVLFIAADDLRMNLGCYGDKVAVTPHLDQLAARGMVFDRAYCQFPSCNASRASLLTGMRPDTISVWRLNTHFRKTAPDVVTLPQYFRRHGYHTESIGKILHNYAGITDDENSWSTPARFAQINHFGDYALKDSKPGKMKGIAAESADVGDDAYIDGKITEDALATIQRLTKEEKPFFLAVGFLKPHSPYNAPKKYWDLYDRNDIRPLGPTSRPEGVTDLAWFNFVELTGFSDVPRTGPLTKKLAARLRHGYYAATSYVDANVGRLLEALEESGEAENTIVIFWSDHGYHLGENGHWTKVTARDLDGHVPLIVHAPGKTAGRTKAIVEYIDIYPTLAGLCELPVPQGLDGRSFEVILDNPKRNGKQAAFTQVCRPWPGRKRVEQMGYSLRTQRYRYTRWVDFKTKKTLAEELYDTKSDPSERNNLIGNPDSAATSARLAKLMDETN